MEDVEIIKLYFDRNQTAVKETEEKYGNTEQDPGKVKGISGIVGIVINTLKLRKEQDTKYERTGFVGQHVRN